MLAASPRLGLPQKYSDAEVELVRELTIAKPYGWVFFYQSSFYLRDPENNWQRQLAGNAPFLIDRINGELRAFGTARSIDSYLEEYERALPKAVLAWRPEQPTW
jgi:hypothetical protein